MLFETETMPPTPRHGSTSNALSLALRGNETLFLEQMCKDFFGARDVAARDAVRTKYTALALSAYRDLSYLLVFVYRMLHHESTPHYVQEYDDQARAEPEQVAQPLKELTFLAGKAATEIKQKPAHHVAREAANFQAAQSAIATTSFYWGMLPLAHYGWLSLKKEWFEQLRVNAKLVQSWEEARVVWNRIMFERWTTYRDPDDIANEPQTLFIRADFITFNKGGQDHTRTMRSAQWWRAKPLTSEEKLKHKISFDEFGIIRPCTSDIDNAATIIMTLNQGDRRGKAHLDAVSPRSAEQDHSSGHDENVARSNSPMSDGALPSRASTPSNFQRSPETQGEIDRAMVDDMDVAGVQDEDMTRHDGDISLDIDESIDYDHNHEGNEMDSSAKEPESGLGLADHSRGDIDEEPPQDTSMHASGEESEDSDTTVSDSPPRRGPERVYEENNHSSKNRASGVIRAKDSMALKFGKRVDSQRKLEPAVFVNWSSLVKNSTNNIPEKRKAMLARDIREAFAKHAPGRRFKVDIQAR